jgi:hypothetical protein
MPTASAAAATSGTAENATRAKRRSLRDGLSSRATPPIDVGGGGSIADVTAEGVTSSSRNGSAGEGTAVDEGAGNEGGVATEDSVA